MRKQTDKEQWKGGIIVRRDGDINLTEQQEKFVNAYVANGGNADAAGKLAGHTNGSMLLLNHNVREAIELKRDMEIKTGGATKAWEVMQSLLTDPAAPAQVRFQAARWTLEASGHGLSAIAAALQLGKGNKKDQHEMTVSELQEVVERGRKQLESMRQIIGEVKSIDDAIVIEPETSKPDKPNG
jgi:Terminase small subunit/Histidine kinase